MDEQFTQPFWDDRYRTATRIWSGRPNPQLVREAEGRRPGHALDAGCGEGADAHWLAGRGWRVTALDISTVALDRGAEHAHQEIADRITWQHADLTTWVPDPSIRYDLVNAQFLQFPSALRATLFDHLAGSVAAGGSLLVVGHHPSDLDTTMHRHHEPDMFFTAQQVAASLDPERWDVLVASARPRSAVDPEGREVTISDAVLHARRRA
jgi:SAM-dependent methyltransferase